MEVYIDKENLRSFIHAQNNPQYKDCYDDCYRLLKRQLHINYNFSKSRELLDDEEFRSYFMMSMQGVGNSESDSFFENKFPSRAVGFTTPNEFNKSQRSSVYLIADSKIDEFKTLGTTMTGGLGEEIDTLKRLFCGKNDFDFHKLYNLQDRNSFPSWEQICFDELNLPLSDIIIMDRYAGAFSERPEADRNLYKIIDVLVENTRSKVNVVIICDRTYDAYINGKKEEVSIDTTFISECIVDIVCKKTSFEPNVTMIINPSNKEIKGGVISRNIRRSDSKILNHPHDRLIFTNYMLYRSGDSFYNYFDNEGQLKTEGTALDVNSLARKSNYDFAMSILDGMQLRCDKISQYFPDHIIGDKKSNYIEFK